MSDLLLMLLIEDKPSAKDETKLAADEEVSYHFILCKHYAFERMCNTRFTNLDALISRLRKNEQNLFRYLEV